MKPTHLRPGDVVIDRQSLRQAPMTFILREPAVAGRPAINVFEVEGERVTLTDHAVVQRLARPAIGGGSLRG